MWNPTEAQMTCLFSSIQPQCLIRLHNLCHFCQWCFVSHSAWVGSPVQSSVFILPIQDTNVYQPSLQKLLLILNILIKSKKVSLTFSSTQLKKHTISFHLWLLDCFNGKQPTGCGGQEGRASEDAMETLFQGLFLYLLTHSDDSSFISVIVVIFGQSHYRGPQCSDESSRITEGQGD